MYKNNYSKYIINVDTSKRKIRFMKNSTYYLIKK